jgi:uncharacterized RDD family membrane protein YckC
VPDCRECSRDFAPDEVIAFGDILVCGACKPIFVQKLREGLLPPQRLPFAGFWIRGGSLTIDYIVLYIIMMIVAGVGVGISGFRNPDPFKVLRLEGLLLGIQFLIATSYETWFVGKNGATPGMVSCRLQLIRGDGSSLGFQRALFRCLARLASSFTFGIGYLMAAFDEENRTLHDYICDTRVVRK